MRLVLWGGGCLVWGLGWCAWSGGVCAWSTGGGVPGLGGVPGPGVSGPGGGVPCPWGVRSEGGGGGFWSGGVSQHAMRQTHLPPPPVERQTPVKILPWPNFVAAGKNGKQ